MKKLFIALLFFMCFFHTVSAQQINPDSYPAADKKEWGQLLWVIELVNQPIDDFSNFQQVNAAGVSACRYTLGFTGYFLGVEQYHKFPAWQEEIKKAYNRTIEKMMQKAVWSYWSDESSGVTKFEPLMDRPYAPVTDPIVYRNIMYSGHLAMMINQFEVLYNDMKWDAPNSIVLKWDDHTQFLYDNESLQFAMFDQFIKNPVPGIECEPNAIFPACNQMPLLSWWYYDYLHGTRFFSSAQPLFSEWFKNNFINPETHGLGAFYLVKQGWVFSEWTPKFGNAADAEIKKQVDKGVSFYSAGNDGWILIFMHAYDKELVDTLWPYLKKLHIAMQPDGTAVINPPDALIPDSDYGFFAALAAEVGDEEVKNGLLMYCDKNFAPVWQDGTYHYPFADKATTLDLVSAGGTQEENKGSAKKESAPATNKTKDAKGGLCCKRFNKMKTMPQHSDVSDRTLALARALPKDGMHLMYTKPFDSTYFKEPKITNVDIAKLALKRAIYDRDKKSLIVSTFSEKTGGSSSFNIINLNPSENYDLFIDKVKQDTYSGKATIQVKVDLSKPHNIILTEK